MEDVSYSLGDFPEEGKLCQVQRMGGNDRKRTEGRAESAPECPAFGLVSPETVVGTCMSFLLSFVSVSGYCVSGLFLCSLRLPESP